MEFGILLRHPMNEKGLGAMVRLERIIKKYSTGESDIIVRCHDYFRLERFMQEFPGKLYPGGTVETTGEITTAMAGLPLVLKFSAYRERLGKPHRPGIISVFHIAAELNLDIRERLAFATLTMPKRETYLESRIEFQGKLLDAEERSRDVFHLN